MHFKPALSKQYLKIALKKMHFSKNIPKLRPQKMYFKNMSNCPLKIPPLKNAFQNCYKLSIGNKNPNPVSLKTLDM